jgi:uncharacterized Zn finger protein
MNDRSTPIKKRRRKSAVPAKPKVKPLGATWWGHRWIEALEHTSRDVVARLGRGRAYARGGHVHELQIKSGVVTAAVTDDELDSYAVSLKLETFDAKIWHQVISQMHQQALFVAQLLNGEMPREINRLFRACGKSLFPANPHDIDADCGCEDWSSPCKHVAATHYVLGEALDDDPFLLFELRGRSKEQVLAALSQLRSTTAGPGTQTGTIEQSNGVALTELAAQNFEQAAMPLPSMQFHFDVPAVAGSLLRSLGQPASWTLNESPSDLLAPVLAQARDHAYACATGFNAVNLHVVSSKDAAEKTKRKGRRNKNRA